jgi:molybdate transport system substrate-binding protein
MAISRTVNALLRANYKTIATTVLGLLVTLATVAAAGAAEIKVFSTIGFRAILQELGPQFEKTSGHKLTTTFDVAAALKRRVEAGEPFDIAVLTVPIMSDLIRQGKIVANTRIDLARGGMGLAVRTGSPKSDVSSTEALKRTLLGAKSIVYPKEGLAGTNFTRIQERLGIAEAIKPKARLTGSDSPAELVARGEAEIAVHIIPELVAVKGVELLGPFPAELQSYIVLPGGVAVNAVEPKAANEFLQFLVGPAARPVMTRRGYESGT